MQRSGCVDDGPALRLELVLESGFKRFGLHRAL